MVKKWLAGVTTAAVCWAQQPRQRSSLSLRLRQRWISRLVKQLESDAWKARLFQLDDKIVIGKSRIEVPAANGAVAIHVGDDMDLGGFSGLTHIPGDPANVFYTHTDRGPNGDLDPSLNCGCKTFAVPKFSPQIVKVSLENGNIKVLKQIPLKLANGALDPITGTSYISGVSNFPNKLKTDAALVGYGVADEVPIDSVTYNPDGTY